jgi:hypothetical protein
MGARHSAFLVFDPKGFLVASLDNSEACERARTVLLEAGFGPENLRVYNGQEILENHEVYLAARSRTRGVVGALIVGALTDDQSTVDLYFRYAKEGRAAPLGLRP